VLSVGFTFWIDSAMLRRRRRRSSWSPPARASDATCANPHMMPAKTKSKTTKRTLIEPHTGDKRYVRRNKQGEFNKEVDVGRSLAADRRSKANTKVPKGQGDRGDVKR